MCSHETHSRLPHRCSKQSILTPTSQSATLGTAPDPGEKRRTYTKKGVGLMIEIKKEQRNNDPDYEISGTQTLQKNGPDAEQILSFLQSNGMIDVDSVANAMKKKEVENIINRNHKK